MATGAKMSFNHYQNGKFGTLSQNSQNMEVSQDMHLKMSKKIAQLTKVIYALNTKNDEHDVILQGIKDQHEEQMQQLLGETRHKIEEYRQKVAAEADQTKKVQELESFLLENNRQKQNVLAEFEKYKKESEEREIHFKTEHSQRMISLSQEVLTAKKDFEERLRHLNGFKDEQERDKLAALENLQARHRQELDEALRSQQAQQSDLASSQNELKDWYEADMTKLKEQLEKLDASKAQLCEEYEAKLSKAQAFYEKELDALKKSQTASHEERLTASQEQNDKLKKDMAFQESQFKQRIDTLINQLSVSEEEIARYKNELSKLQHNLQNKDSDSDFLNKQLLDAKQQVSDTLTRLKELETELTASRERCDQQAKQLLKKSTELGALEATKLQHESTIQDLQAQLEKLKDRVKWLEGSKRSLENESQSQVQQQSGQLRSLERALEDLSKEKQKMKEYFEQELKEQEESWQKRRRDLEDGHQQVMTSVEHRHKDQTEANRKSAEARLETLKQDLNVQMDAERQKMERERSSLQGQYDQMETQLSSKLAEAEKEIERLEKVLTNSEQGLGSATSNINSLKEQSDKLRAELEQNRMELRAAKTQASTLEAEYAKLKLLHESKTKEAEIELKTKLEQLAKDLDNKWTDTLRAQCEKLRRDLTEQKDEDKRAALAQMMLLKENEMEAAKQGWERKVSELLAEISQLKKELDSQKEVVSGELDRLRQNADGENQRLRQELHDSAEEYQRKVASLEEAYKAQLDQLEHRKDREAKEAEEKLRSEHMQAMQAELRAHTLAVQSVKDVGETSTREQLSQLKAQHEERMDALKTELEHKLAMEMEQTQRAHQMQMQAARMELDRAIELTKHKEAEYAMRVSELEEDVRHRQLSIERLEEDIRGLRKGIKDMSHELEAKGKEVLRIRSEANHAARVREEQLQNAHREEMSAIHSDHAQEAQAMLAEFAQAQDLLKDKIAELKIMLEEAEDRYNQRDSRPEDLEKIQALQHAVREREQVLKKMQDEKKYYQMELVNRETNFNKVFSASPNVGVLNPFQTGKKGKDRGAMKVSSSPAVIGRLQPLPGSPIHDEKFNPNKPLPPPAKKFVH